jgi:hypothetical protein
MSQPAVYASLLTRIVDHHDDLVRNIKGIRQSQDLFDDLSDQPEDWKVAVAAEAAAYIPSPAPLITRPFDYGAVITFPFVNFNAQGTRFSDGLDYGVWYGSFDIETTVYETVHHWHVFVTDSFAGEDREIAAERRVLRTRCDAILIDLRGREREERLLVDRRDYRYTQRLGRYLKMQHQNGLLVRSARCDGTNAAVLQPDVLSNVRDQCFLTYRMNPTRDAVRVERSPGRKWMEIAPSALR